MHDIYQGNCLDFLRTARSESIDLVLTSPPYNIGKTYERKTTLSSYLDAQEAVISELYRVLKATGSICWQVGNHVDDGEVFPLDIFYYPMFAKLGMKMRNRIVWTFGHGLHCKNRFSGRYETLLFFTKTDDYTFNLDSVRVPSKYPGKRYYKGERAGELSGNPLGKNPSDIWSIMLSEWDEGIYDIPNVKNNHPEKTIHPCQFPVELAERCILAMTNHGDMVLDPYAGVGSTLIAAEKNGRNAYGCELNSEYVSIAARRLSDLRNGNLKTRKIGTPIHVPSGRLAERPGEWDA